MKGIVFVLLSQLVEEKFGLDEWDNLIDKVNPPNKGAYSASSTYPDEELFAYVGAIHEKTGIPVPDLVRTFGEYMFPNLAKKYPVFVENQSSLKSFLLTIHDVIHVEVKKLYPDAGLPHISYEDDGDDSRLVMIYRSERKLCPLSEGLIYGAAKHFNTTVTINHDPCMHQGSDHCRLALEFS